MITLTAERLRAELDYCRITGNFYWRRSRKGVNAGDVAGSRNALGYVIIGLWRKKYLAHRLAWLHVYGRWPVGLLDHRDRNQSNNRFANLREALPTESNANRNCRADSTIGLKGVSPNGSGFCARLMKDGERLYLGQFDTPEAAHDVYMQTLEHLYGEFALPKSSITSFISQAVTEKG
ncbi:MAG: HNH endonuclease [Hyphomicrobium sp.]